MYHIARQLRERERERENLNSNCGEESLKTEQKYY